MHPPPFEFGDAINLRTHFGGGTITGVPANYVVSVDYAFNGTDSLGRVGTGNDLAVTITLPEPSTFGLVFAGGALLLLRLRQRLKSHIVRP